MATGREALRVQLIAYTCSQNCMGVRGNSGGCCTLDDRDFIIGPVRDADAFLADLGRRLGREVSRDEAFIDFDEGRALFPERPTWQEPAECTADLTVARQQVIDLLGTSPTAVDDVVRRCQFSAAAVMAVMLELELAGRIQELARG